MSNKFLESLTEEQQNKFVDILKNYLFEANNYETTGKLGKDLNKEFPEYFFRCFPSSINEMDVVFRVFKLKESFITPMAVFNYLDI